MTAFDNIKTNNWPATSNEFEDFLVLKMPLNDNASLTESLLVSAGSQELSPKRTLTNTGVKLVQPRSVVNVKLHTYIYNTPGTLTVNGNTVPRGSDPNGDVTFTVAVNGGLSSIAWSYDSSNGPYCYMKGIEVDLGDGNGYQLIQDGAFGVSAYSSLISGTVDSSYPLSNLFGGTIGSGYTNGTRHTSPGTLTLDLSSVFPAKKHYDNNASFNGSSVIDVLASSDYAFSGDFTIEFWVNTSAKTADGVYRRMFVLDGPTGDTGTNLSLNIDASSGHVIAWGGNAGPGAIVNQGVNIADGAWHHVACVRQGTSVSIYVDGSIQGTGTDSRSLFAGSTPAPRLGGASTSSGRMNGFMQDVRVYKGVAKYTSNFTPPSAILG